MSATWTINVGQVAGAVVKILEMMLNWFGGRKRRRQRYDIYFYPLGELPPGCVACPLLDLIKVIAKLHPHIQIREGSILAVKVPKEKG